MSILGRQLRKRLEWRRHAGRLSSIETMAEFERHVESVRPEYFLLLRGRAEGKRAEIRAVLEALEIDPRDKTFLDLGPGHGESLDVFHEGGAREIHFIDYDPFFFTYNRLKGFARGVHGNHFVEIKRLEPDRYDFVWVKGSIRDDAFRRFGWLHPLGRWLVRLDRVLAPGGTAVINPYWATTARRREQPDVRDTTLTRTLLDHGYTILPPIEAHNSEPSYPISYLRRKA